MWCSVYADRSGGNPWAAAVHKFCCHTSAINNKTPIIARQRYNSIFFKTIYLLDSIVEAHPNQRPDGKSLHLHHQNICCSYVYYSFQSKTIYPCLELPITQKRPRVIRGRFSLLAPQVGLEPTAYRLTAGCSTIELLRNIDPATTYSPGGNPQVPSAQKGLTSVFGMGTGGTPSP